MRTINKEKESSLSHDELLRLLHYDEKTGIFTRKTASGGMQIGSVAGYISKSHGYVEISINNYKYLAHRLAWFFYYKKWPINLIDHKDTIRSHNWIDNLRESNHSLNGQNKRKAQSNNSSGSSVCGVSYRKDRNKYSVRLVAEGKSMSFGCFQSLEEAEQVCVDMRRKHFMGNMI